MDMDIPDKTAEKTGFDCCAGMKATEAPLGEEQKGPIRPFLEEHCSVSEGFPSNK